MWEDPIVAEVRKVREAHAAQFNYTKNFELVMVCRKGNAVLAQPASTSHIVASKDDLTDTLGHPFAKPFACWEFLLKHLSLPGQRILDPFAGCGSGVISALKMERHVVGCEINEKHFNALWENVKRYYTKINPDFIFK